MEDDAALRHEEVAFVDEQMKRPLVLPKQLIREVGGLNLSIELA